MVRAASALATLALCGSAIAAAKCAASNKCPESSPCCSQYGECGVGAYCLGGCDPLSSFSLDACMPAPVCEDRKMKMDSLDGIMDASKYLGDPSTADWVSQGTPLAYDGNVLLTMPANTSGTVLASTVYMWYGNVSVTMKTSKDAGVITAFIFLGDVKDEIDFEWVGTELEIAQTNYFWQAQAIEGTPGNITGLSNVNENFHTYTVEWLPESIKWYVDGKLGMTRMRSDAWNSTGNQWDFPQTPARIQLSVWPGGASSNAPGTIEWSGGPIDWDSDAIKEDGYYFATIGEITFDCYQTNKAPGTNSGKSYIYNGESGLNTTVEDGDKGTTLSSIFNSGLDPNKSQDDKPSQSSQATVPGGSTQGTGQGGPSQSGDDSGKGGTNDGGDSSSSSGGCTSGGFSQEGCNDDSDGDGTSEGSRNGALGASGFAALIAVGAMLWL